MHIDFKRFMLYFETFWEYSSKNMIDIQIKLILFNSALYLHLHFHKVYGDKRIKTEI